MLKNKNKKINNNEPLKKWIWTLVVVFVFCFFSYGYCVRGAIVNIVDRQKMESEISVLASRVLDLESEYIKTKNSISLDMANELGFVSISNQIFVTQTVTNPGLSLITPTN
jgi:hypothetical protein